MCNELQKGIKEALTGAIVGFLISPVLNFVPFPYREIGLLISLFPNIVVLKKIEYMGIKHLLGWLIGTFIVFLILRLVGTQDPWIIIYSIVGFISLIAKGSKRLGL